MIVSTVYNDDEGRRSNGSHIAEYMHAHVSLTPIMVMVNYLIKHKYPVTRRKYCLMIMEFIPRQPPGRPKFPGGPKPVDKRVE